MREGIVAGIVVGLVLTLTTASGQAASLLFPLVGDWDQYFHVDAQSVVVQALAALADAGEIPREKVAEAFAKYRIDDPTAVADVKQEGGDA